MSASAWEAIFMLLVLKIPLVYLSVVVWYAVRAEPRAEEGPDEVGVLVPLTPCNWDDWRHQRPSPRRRWPPRPTAPRVAAARLRPA